MVIANLNHSDRVSSLCPELKMLFDYVRNNDTLNAPLGRIELDGERLFINNVNSDCVDVQYRPLEMHRKYIDVHILLEGEETIGWKSVDDIQHYSQDYCDETDCALSDDTPTSLVSLLPGQICIVWPEDAHAPLIGQGKVRKLIAKVLCQ